MIVLDAMEYSSDALAQAAWVASNAVVSQGKTYSKTAPNALYPDSGDAELTNGTVATGDYSDANWTAWAAPDDPNVVIDLGVSSVLASVRFHFYSAAGYLIGGPSTLEVYGSNNGVDFTSIGSFSIGGGNLPSGNYLGWSNPLAVTGTYRYIKFNFTHTSNWIFLSEIQVNADSIKVYSESSIKQQGSYSLKLVAALTTTLNTTVTRTLSPTFNLSGQTSFKFHVRSSRTGSNFKIGLHDSGGTTTEVTPNIAVADTFQEVTLDLSAVADADKDAIDSIILTITNADAANTIYIDYLVADNVTWPDAKYVYHGVDRGDGTTGTLHASTISEAAGAGSNLSAGILKDGEVVDDVTGTYAGGGTDFPDPANVLEGDTTNGVPGTYHEAATSEVQYGVTFGPSQSYTGTYGQSAVGSEDDIIKNLFTAIYSRFTTVTNDLNTDVTGRMYKDVAEEGAAFPYVVVSLISDVNLYETFTDEFYDVYIQFSLYSNSTAGSAEIENMYSHLKELYDNCTIAPTGSYFYWMRRESATRIDDDITTENGNSHVYGYAVNYYIKIEKH